MPNTSLPTTVTAGTIGHAGFHNTVHTELNRMTRDTGLLDLSSKLINGWTLDSGGYVYLRRRDNTVELHVQGLNGSAATTQSFLKFGTAEPDISTRFRPAPIAGVAVGALSPLFRQPSGATAPVYFFYNANGNMQCVLNGSPGSPAPGTGGSLMTWTWTTEEAWPNFLPPAKA